MHERTIHNVLAHGRTIPKGGSNPPNHPGLSHPGRPCNYLKFNVNVKWNLRTVSFAC